MGCCGGAVQWWVLCVAPAPAQDECLEGTWQGLCVGTTRAPLLLNGQVSISQHLSVHPRVCV